MQFKKISLENFIGIVKKVLTICQKSVYNSKAVSDKLTGNGILAQLGEHLPYKQRVTGSSPVGPISLLESKKNFWLLYRYNLK